MSSLEEIMQRLAKMQVGCPSVLPQPDWAKEARENGNPIPSAHICMGWVQPDFEALIAERDAAIAEAAGLARAVRRLLYCGDEGWLETAEDARKALANLSPAVKAKLME